MMPEQEKVRSLLVETITLLCRNSFTFANDIKLQGLLAITIDSKQFFVVQIDETLDNLGDRESESNDLEKQLELNHLPLTNPKQEQVFVPEVQLKGRKRRRSSTTAAGACRPTDSVGLHEKDIFRVERPSRRSKDLPEASARIKEEDEDVLLVGTSESLSAVARSYEDCDDSRPDAVETAKDFHENILVEAGASESCSGAQQMRRRQPKKRMPIQWNSYEGPVEWGEQSDQSRTDALANYILETGEEKFHSESQQDIMGLNPGRLNASNWSPGEQHEFQSWESSLQQQEHHYYHQHQSLSSISSWKPYACRYPGCQKRFRHETHTRRHERETHKYYRQRQSQRQRQQMLLLQQQQPP